MERFRFIRKLSRGVHGTVYLLETIDSGKEKMACKSILWKYKKYAEREVKILSLISHKRIVKLLDFFPRDSGIFIILEYVNCGSLHEMISHLVENNYRAPNCLVWSVLVQIADGLRYLHNKHIAHRDIKPSNILIERVFVQSGALIEFKLCDFAMAKELYEGNRTCEIAGTPSYMAPEVVSREYYNISIDIWSLGVSVYELLTLKKPFEGRSRDELFGMIKQARLPQVISPDIELERLIRRCLSKNDRISSGAIFNDKKAKAHLEVSEAELGGVRRFLKMKDRRNIDK
ncbi:NimA-like Ser/Thr protein kinase [Encephalitozoon romaleae SJ-2008]|uniref:non-specific serine/threonine protein kinase n=1 Tax=Encephalitozoon romaleae (strain SJ-2008) TaxID=1178016 RepID=I7AH34_ENCRO|nr:NimA-like Ser/Thr protein kinase [Encephalitozoon romaleae SJ-2008]AFN84120.1 NimA-like Ser/Thr protein kinase [Encephalitozoon romaleae SJ-2008]